MVRLRRASSILASRTERAPSVPMSEPVAAPPSNMARARTCCIFFESLVVLLPSAVGFLRGGGALVREPDLGAERERDAHGGDQQQPNARLAASPPRRLA